MNEWCIRGAKSHKFSKLFQPIKHKPNYEKYIKKKNRKETYIKKKNRREENRINY